MRNIPSVLLLALAFVLVVVFALSPWGLEPASFAHSGKSLMDEDEYQSFKQLMASDEVTDYSVEILNTSYPIVVQYTFAASFEQTVLPGEKPVSRARDSSTILLMLFAAIFPIVLAVHLWQE